MADGWNRPRVPNTLQQHTVHTYDEDGESDDSITELYTSLSSSITHYPENAPEIQDFGGTKQTTASPAVAGRGAGDPIELDEPPSYDKRKRSEYETINHDERKRTKIIADDAIPQEIQSSLNLTIEAPKNKILITDQAQVKCIPTHQVQMASRLVGQMLNTWPEASPGVQKQAAASLEQFATQVFLPYIVAYYNHQKPITAKARTIVQNRIFYATLLVMREVLAQNARAIFRIPKYDEASDPHQQLSNQRDLIDESEFISLLMATTVVMNACEAAGNDPQELLDLVEKDNFPIAKPFAKIVQQNGKTMGENEALAWKVGYNLAQKKRQKQDTTLPAPTSCYISIVEQIPEEVE